MENEIISTVISTTILDGIISTTISTTTLIPSMISIAVKKSLIQKFSILAAENDIPRKDLIEEALEQYLISKNKL